MTTDAPYFVDIVTRPIDAADETPPRRDRINYHSKPAQDWLIRHTWWALHRGFSVNVAPAEDIAP